MRYAIVTETYPPEVNGVALTVQGLENGLRARGHDVSVVRPRQSDADTAQSHELLVRSAQIPRYPGMRFGFPSTGALIKQWQTAKPDAVYIATEGPLGWSAMRAAQKLNIPVASGFHTRFDEYTRDYGVGFLEPLALKWMRGFHNKSKATIVPTCELADFLIKEQFQDVVHMPRAVNTKQFDPSRRDPALRAEWGVGEDDLVVSYMGRIAAEKNLGLAVRAYREIQKVRANTKFVLIGIGPELDTIAKANPDFIIAGLRRGDELARWFASTDLFLFPSHSETFGNVTLEAMASGVTTVAFNYGACKEHLRDGISGAAINDRDDEAFIAAALKFASDDALRKQMAEAAREAVAKLRPEQVAADFDEVLLRISGHWRGQHAQSLAA